MTSQDPTTLSDLRIATPFSYVHTFVVLPKCAASPTSFTLWYTAIVDGIYYPAKSEIVQFGNTTTIYQTYTFTALTLPMLTPGELISIVWKALVCNTYERRGKSNLRIKR